MLGRQLRIFGRRGSKGEAWTEENRKLGRRREDRERRDGELLSRVRMRSAAAGRKKIGKSRQPHKANCIIVESVHPKT